MQCFRNVLMLGAFISNTLSAVAIVFRANLEDFSIEFK